MLRMISNALGRPHSTRPSSPRQCEKALPPRPEQQVSLRGQLSFGELEIRKRAMQTFKYSDLLQHLEPFDDWLRTLGLTPRREDRIHQAFETPRMADAASRAGRETGEYTTIAGEHLFQWTEALEAHDIFMAFEKEPSEVLARALLMAPFRMP